MSVLRLSPAATATLFAWPVFALAQTPADPTANATIATASNNQATPAVTTLDSISVNGKALPRAKGAEPVATRNAEELRQFGLINTEDALNNMPNTAVRKRYIGDRNALIAGRSFGNTQAPRGLVLADGFLLSNFLGRFNAPRWNMVAPEELDSIAVLHGSFSAVLQGNSIGTTVLMTTREPQTAEGSIRGLAYSSSFKLYGQTERFGGDRESLWAGTRLGNFSFSVSADRLASSSHPMQFYAFGAPLVPSAANSNATVVTGAISDTAPNGSSRLTAGASGGAVEDGVQQHLKLRGNWQVLPGVKLSGFFSQWRNNYERDNRSFLRDAAGNTVWDGLVSVGGVRYSIPAASYALSNGVEEHRMSGVRLATSLDSGFNYFLTLSKYDIVRDDLRTSNLAQPRALSGGSGIFADGQGTGWFALDARARYSASDKSWDVEFGGQRYLYRLNNRSLNTADWRNQATSTSLASGYGGKTLVDSLYVQASAKPSSGWTLDAGLRYDTFNAYAGSQTIAGAAPKVYAARSGSAWSPKIALAYDGVADWRFKAAYGRGMRYPTVSELFQGSRSGTSIVTPDPLLGPERSDASEWSASRSFETGTLKVALYQDTVRNAIFSQTGLQNGITASFVQNVPLVRTRGLELTWEAQDWLLKGLTLNSSLAFNNAKTVRNSVLPSSEGKNWPRVPAVRASVTALYQVNALVGVTAAVRHSGRVYNELNNSDIVGNTFGGQSNYTVADVKLTLRPAKGAELALGVENLGNSRYYSFHPMPQRTVYIEGRYNF